MTEGVAEKLSTSELVSKEVCEERHEALRQYLSNDKDKIKTHDCEIRDVKEAIVVLTAIQARHDNSIEDHEVRIRGIETKPTVQEKYEDTIEDHETRLRDIENKPARRWELTIDQITIATIACVIGGVIGKFLF